MIERAREVETVRKLLHRHPVVEVIGARQVGKTTLARSLLATIKGSSSYYDLENPEDLVRLADPMLTLKQLKGLVVIDEIQQQPDLYRILRVLVDRPRPLARFLLLGSASPELIRRSSETLAGRIFYHELGGLSLDEAGVENTLHLCCRGDSHSLFLHVVMPKVTNGVADSYARS